MISIKNIFISVVDYSDLGERFEEQVGAAERVNLHILEHFFKNRGMNESNVAVEEDDSAPVQVRMPVMSQ